MIYYFKSTTETGWTEYIATEALPGEGETVETGVTFRMVDTEKPQDLPESTSLLSKAQQSFASDQYEKIQVPEFRRAFAKCTSGLAHSFYVMTSLAQQNLEVFAL